MITKKKLREEQAVRAFWEDLAARKADQLIATQQELEKARLTLLHHQRISAYIRMLQAAHAAHAVNLRTVETTTDGQTEAHFSIDFDPSWLTENISDYWGDMFVDEIPA